jgi:peptidoglycan/xylan/chitin deacetylase (PgdA/CDA1 family)
LTFAHYFFMKNRIYFLLVSFAFIFSACHSNGTSPGEKTAVKNDTAIKTTDTVQTNNDKNRVVADAATILARKEVPVLCYHHIIEGKPTNDYQVTVATFKEQMKMLADSGYHSVLPDQLYNYLAFGDPLPAKPFMITFDDTDEEQFTVGKTEMDKYGFKGVYFIMTISIGKPRYMSKEQIRQLSDEGHAVEAHTWRHDRVDRYLTTPHIDKGTNKLVENDWDLQLGKEREKLENISGKRIYYFAYPFGIWTPAAFPELKKRNFNLAFQLYAKRDSTAPLYTVRRVIVAPTWSAAGMLRVMATAFKQKIGADAKTADVKR